MAFNPTAYKKQYNDNHYDIIKATVPKGGKDVVKEYAYKQGVSVSQLIVDALKSCYGIKFD